MGQLAALLSVIIVLTCAIVRLEAHRRDMYAVKYQNLLYGSTANLTCTDESFDPLDFPSARFQWILPSTLIINETTLYDSSHYSFHNNGSTLIVNKIDKPDFGLYYCLVLTHPFSVHTTIRLGVNINGPYFGDLVVKYTSNMKMGLAAGGVVFIIMAMFCFNYDQFQARHDKPRERDTVLMNNKISRPNYDNAQEMCCINNGFIDDPITAEMSPEDASIQNCVNKSVVITEVSEDKTSF